MSDEPNKSVCSLMTSNVMKIMLEINQCSTDTCLVNLKNRNENVYSKHYGTLFSSCKVDWVLFLNTFYIIIHLFKHKTKTQRRGKKFLVVGFKSFMLKEKFKFVLLWQCALMNVRDEVYLFNISSDLFAVKRSKCP